MIIELVKVNSKDKSPMVCGMWADAPVYIRKRVATWHYDHPSATNKEKETKPYLTIKMPCGEESVYRNAKVIPSRDEPCTCGDPTHFFIKYGEEYMKQFEVEEATNDDSAGPG